MSQQIDRAVKTMALPDTLEAQLEVAREHLFELVTDHSHFTARWLTAFKEKAGAGINMNEVTLAKIIANIFGIWLAISEHAEFATNFILTGVPLLLFFIYPDEKAADEDMLIYWPCYALISLFDFMLKSIPGWFSLKLLLFALFFLPPWRLVGKIRLLLWARQLYMAGSEVSRQAQNSINELSHVPTEMLSQLLAAQESSSAQQEMPPHPPASLLVSQPAHSSSTAQQPARSSSTARQSVRSSSIALQSARSSSIARQPATSTSTARRDASAEQIRTAERLIQKEPAPAKDPSQYTKSFYVDLKPRSKPKIVDSQQSAYMTTPHATTMANGNGEQQ